MIFYKKNTAMERRKWAGAYSKHGLRVKSIRLILIVLIAVLCLSFFLSFYLTKTPDKTIAKPNINEILRKAENYTSNVKDVEYKNSEMQTDIKAKKVLQKGEMINLQDVKVKLQEKKQTLTAPRVTVDRKTKFLKAYGRATYEDQEGLKIKANTFSVKDDYIVRGRGNIQADKDNVKVKGDAFTYDYTKKILKVKGNVKITIKE